jgi:hypothetical protein
MASVPGIQPVRARIFWGEMAPCEHLMQVYGDEDVFLDSLTGFVGGGLREGESAIVLATAPHLHALEKRLRADGIDVDRARWEDRYVALLAEETLGKFMVDGWPDDERFLATMGELLERTRRHGRTVRAFGELVAVLWSRGMCAATVRLELLWAKLVQEERFALFCAYPKAGFTEHPEAYIRQLCTAHSRTIPG